MDKIRWERYPLVAQHPQARVWLSLQAKLGLAPNTVDAYGRDVEDYFAFCRRNDTEPNCATHDHLAAYLQHLRDRPHPRATAMRSLAAGAGLANATLQRRLTAVRLYYDYLIAEGVRDQNPVGRGRFTPGAGFGSAADRGLLPRYRKLPWIPTDEEWRTVLAAARSEPLRNRVMLALAYDAALRREELCALAVGDLDPAQRLIRICAETTKNRQERMVPYSAVTSKLYAAYLQQRRTLSRERGPLFLSESRRNYAQPISIWTWSKVVATIAARAQVPQFTTHTLRHLCLTDLARAGWDIHEIALFAGHRSIQTTLLYIHRSGRELTAKVERGMASIHAWRVAMAAEVLA